MGLGRKRGRGEEIWLPQRQAVERTMEGRMKSEDTDSGKCTMVKSVVHYIIETQP